MVNWKIVYTKQAQKDAKKLSSSGLKNMGHLSVSGRIFKELVFYKLLVMFLNLIFFVFPGL